MQEQWPLYDREVARRNGSLAVSLSANPDIAPAPTNGICRVEVALAVKGNELVITLDDDGCGIADAERNRVLDRGERADELVPGSGLGLAIVGDLARLYGGRIEFTDSPLGGLRVLLTLPRATDSDGARSASARTRRG